MIRSFYSMRSLFFNTLLFFGLFNSCLEVFAVPVSLVSSSNDASGVIKYPIHVACECMFTLYVDGKYIGEGNKENYVPYGLITEWNDTKKYYPVISENEPKIVAFHGVGGQYPAFLNGFIMDMNDGKQYTRHEEWRCKYFSKTANKVAPENWFAFDYDDSDWVMAASYGANYQNNSFQIFENPRDSISLNAEWLWTEDNAASNIYCRKKNEHVSTIHVSQTSAPPPVQTSAPRPVQTSAPPSVQTSAPPSVQTSAPHSVQTSAPPPVQTSAPHSVHTSAPPSVQTSAPRPVQTSAPPPVQTSAPPVSQTIHTPPVQTSAPRPVLTSAPPPVQTSAPPSVQTSAPPVSQTIHTPPVQTSAPPSVQTSAPPPVQISAPPSVQTSAPPVSQTIHTPPVQTSAPPVSQTSAPSPLPLPKVIISPHIQIVIQNIKYSQRLSNAHLENLLRRIKLYNDEYILYRELTLARLHLRRHYKALLYDIKHVLEKHDTDDTDDTDDTHDKSYNKKTVKNIPHFIRSMHTLNASIKKIEQSIHFIKGNHKYILMKILNKLKMRYQEDTQKLFTFFNHD